MRFSVWWLTRYNAIIRDRQSQSNAKQRLIKYRLDGFIMASELNNLYSMRQKCWVSCFDAIAWKHSGICKPWHRLDARGAVFGAESPSLSLALFLSIWRLRSLSHTHTHTHARARALANEAGEMLTACSTFWLIALWSRDDASASERTRSNQQSLIKNLKLLSL